MVDIAGLLSLGLSINLVDNGVLSDVKSKSLLHSLCLDSFVVLVWGVVGPVDLASNIFAFSSIYHSAYFCCVTLQLEYCNILHVFKYKVLIM